MKSQCQLLQNHPRDKKKEKKHACLKKLFTTRLFKAGLQQPRVDVKHDCRLESFKRKFSSATFVYNLMIGCPEKNRENHTKKAF